MPPRIGAVSGRARDRPLVPDRAPLGSSQPTGALVPGVCQAGSLLEPQHWSSQPNSNASLLSPSAVPARLEEQQHTAQLTTKPRRGAKRAASEPTPAAPPLGKKKKRVGKKASKSKLLSLTRRHGLS